MRFWKKKRKREPAVDAIFEKMLSKAFPGGEEQIELETCELVSLLDQKQPKEYVRESLVFAKGRVMVALNSTGSFDEILTRCTNSICVNSQHRVDRPTAEKIADFAVRKLIEQNKAAVPPSSMPVTTDLSKKEALTIARISAFRLARHRSRTDADIQEYYNVDPATCILAFMDHFLWAGKPEGSSRKVESRQDAIALSLDVTQTLVLTYYVEKFGSNPSNADFGEIDRLAKLEWERTLDLLRNEESERGYLEFDPSEARAANDIQVPFNVVLRLGEVGLLRDPPSPTKARLKVISDAVKRVQVR